MPQMRNTKAVGLNFVVSGHGSDDHMPLDFGMLAYRRADHLNQLEIMKLRKRRELLERHAREREHQQQRKSLKISESMDLMNAYRRLVKEEYKVDNFDTLTWGYKAKEAKKDPDRLRRFVYETRVYHSGFSIQSLKKEVLRKLDDIKETQKQTEEHHQRIQKLKQLNTVDLIDRTRSTTWIIEHHKQTKSRKGLPQRLPPIQVASKPHSTLNVTEHAEENTE